MDVSKLEPADRNAKREYTTLIVILVLAAITGAVILYKYNQKSAAQAEEMGKGRAPQSGELKKNYSFVDQDGKQASFFDYTGKATLVACFAPTQLEDSELVFSILKDFAERYKDDDRVQILLLSMEAEGDVDKEKLEADLAKRSMTGEKWNIAFSNGDLFLAYIKNEFKFLHLQKSKNDGQKDWIVSQKIKHLAPDLKLWGRESEYDFGKVLRDQAQARIEAPKDPKFKDHPVFKGDPNKIDLVTYTKEVMFTNMDYMLENEEFDIAALQGRKKENIYRPYLFLFGGFIIFLVVLFLKVKRQQASQS